jgi:N-acetylneuraminate synthase/N,N'-diacetyllegionaminate synthase
MKDIHIYEKIIGINAPIFLIAEAGVNHNGDLSIAKRLIDVASEVKVDAIKFQTFKAEELLLKNTSKAKYQKINTDVSENFYEMIKRYEFTKEDFQSIVNYCKEKNIIFLSTPFDHSSVLWLEEFNVPAYKVGSGDMNNFPLLKLICSKRKPIFISTGMATLKEVKETLEFIRSNNIEEIVLFQCTTDYPTSLEDVNLNVIDTYKNEFSNLLIGFSDHSLGITASIGAAAKGVKVIEKHFTLDKEMKGPDHKASLDPKELKEWVEQIRALEKALGTFEKKPSKAELEIAKIARKSIVSIKALNKGDVLDETNIAVKRPGDGISPVEFEKIIGKRAKRNISTDTVIYWEDIE